MRETQYKKPWLSPSKQVERLKTKGVKFGLMSEREAKQYLAANNNYFRVQSYRKGFPKVATGKRQGQYANLEFKALVDLSIVDMLLRYEMFPLTLDIEHFAKMELLRRIEQNGEDGYAIVSDFLAIYDHVSPDGTVTNRTKNEIEHGKSSPYISGLIESYPDFCFPAWAFLEIISFGTFIYFYKFCGERFSDKEMIDAFYLLQGVKSLRNACAHNNCILNELSAGKPMFAARYEVSNAVSKIGSIKKGQRKAKLKNDRIQQIATTLYVHKLLASRGVIEHRAESLHVLLARMNKHPEYYRGNTQIPSSFSFISSIVEAWYPLNDGLDRR